MSKRLLDRVAGAPITWGVDGSPGWGHLMEPDRVLSEMVEVGLKATELGPDGYLGEDTAAVTARLEHHGLELVGGFIPVVLYEEDIVAGQLAYFERAAATLAAGGAQIAQPAGREKLAIDIEVDVLGRFLALFGAPIGAGHDDGFEI